MSDNASSAWLRQAAGRKRQKNCLEFNTFVSGPVPDNGTRERESVQIARGARGSVEANEWDRRQRRRARVDETRDIGEMHYSNEACWSDWNDNVSDSQASPAPHAIVNTVRNTREASFSFTHATIAGRVHLDARCDKKTGRRVPSRAECMRHSSGRERVQRGELSGAESARVRVE